MKHSYLPLLIAHVRALNVRELTVPAVQELANLCKRLPPNEVSVIVTTSIVLSMGNSPGGRAELCDKAVAVLLKLHELYQCRGDCAPLLSEQESEALVQEIWGGAGPHVCDWRKSPDGGTEICQCGAWR